MEDNNIQDMLEEIKTVVSHHFDDVKYELNETYTVLNNLPLVISLRSELEKLNQENKRLKHSLKKISRSKKYRIRNY